MVPSSLVGAGSDRDMGCNRLNFPVCESQWILGADLVNWNLACNFVKEMGEGVTVTRSEVRRQKFRFFKEDGKKLRELVGMFSSQAQRP